mmetsp:Transcript_34176/g.106089  ORF Transcript_34176/g.106089 Transcript_34176/m.106089 type:complete len:229 (-) Transcript_34176:10-696(-)
MHPAHGEAVELPVQRARDALAHGSLADSRGPHQAHDLALRGLLEEADRDVLQDPLLHVLQPVVVLVQDVLGLLDVLVLLSAVPPGQHSEPLQVGATDVELRGGGLDGPELLELVLDHLACFLWQGLVLYGFAELLNERRLLVLLDAQLFADLLHLLHEHQLALLLRHLLLHLALHVRLQACKLEVLLDYHQDLPQSLHDLVLRKHCLELLTMCQGHAGNKVRQLQWMI